MKKTLIDKAIDKLQGEINDRERAISMLLATKGEQLTRTKREKKSKVTAPVSTRSLSETH